MGACKEAAYCVKPGFSRPSDPAEQGSPVYYPHFIRQSRLEKVEMNCSGNTTGFWITDYVTGEDVRILGPGEECSLSCKDPLFKPKSDTNKISCQEQCC